MHEALACGFFKSFPSHPDAGPGGLWKLLGMGDSKGTAGAKERWQDLGKSEEQKRGRVRG